MVRLIVAVLAWIAFAGAATAQQTPATTTFSPDEGTLFVQAGRLLADPATGVVQRDKTLVISRNQIVAVVDGFVGEGQAGRIVDLRDAFVLPGLIDSHVHLTSQQNPNGRLQQVTLSAADRSMLGAGYARKTLLAGFTTVADLGGTPGRKPGKAKSASVAKYRGPNGELWAGGPGRKPEWVRNAMAEGKNIEDFRI